jgi:pyruvate dehydrogenase E2 component (dihydrolipoamide acetyltransferase)
LIKGNHMIKEVRLPEISENVESGEVIEVLVAVGDVIEEEQSIVELETEKATFEMPSPVRGKVTEVQVKKGETINVGQVILKVETDLEAQTPEKDSPVPEQIPQPPAAGQHVEEIETAPEPVEVGEAQEPVEDRRPVEVTEEKPSKTVAAPASPSVRQLARELGIDIHKVPGSGPRGRISLDDVKNYARAAISSAAAPGAAAMSAVRPLPDFAKWGPVRPEPMTGIRKKTGENLSYTWSSVPQVTQYGRADATELMEFRREYSKRVEEAGGKLTIASILVKVVASALKVFPKFNASVDPGHGQIIYKEYYNIGVAVDTERGLLVPVIRGVDKKNVLQLSVELTALAEKARTGKIGPAEVTGGNFTVSNLGGIAGTYFAPILNWPEVALLGIGRAHQEPVYVNEQLQPRWILPLSLSYDHRIIDGADGARFIDWIIKALEQPFLLAVQE